MADDLVKRIRELEDQLATVLQREAETHARHDAKMEALEVERDRYLRHLTAGAETLNAYKARAEAAEAKLAKARDALRRVVHADFLDFTLSPDRSAVPIARATLKEIGNG